MSEGQQYYKIIEVPGKGRGLIATKDIPCGSVILRDHPYACAVALQEIENRSSWSFQESTFLLKCAGCKFVRCTKIRLQCSIQDTLKFWHATS